MQSIVVHWMEIGIDYSMSHSFACNRNDIISNGNVYGRANNIHCVVQFCCVPHTLTANTNKYEFIEKYDNDGSARSARLAVSLSDSVSYISMLTHTQTHTYITSVHLIASKSTEINGRQTRNYKTVYTIFATVTRNRIWKFELENGNVRQKQWSSLHLPYFQFAIFSIFSNRSC